VGIKGTKLNLCSTRMSKLVFFMFISQNYWNMNNNGVKEIKFYGYWH